MKGSRLILASMLAFTAAYLPAAPAQDHLSAREVVEIMLARDAERQRASRGYTGDREYVLVNRQLQKRAYMLVRVSCDQEGSKHFEVISQNGWTSANQHVLRQMLTAEEASSSRDARLRSQITPDNYDFQMIGSDLLAGRPNYVLEVSPKREDKALFQGRIWVDAEDYALARVEGEPAKTPSFWTQRIHFVQEYRKSGEYWFPVMTTSVTDARVFGRTDVNIRYFDYKPASGARADANLAMMEAYSDKH